MEIMKMNLNGFVGPLENQSGPRTPLTLLRGLITSNGPTAIYLAHHKRSKKKTKNKSVFIFFWIVKSVSLFVFNCLFHLEKIMLRI